MLTSEDLIISSLELTEWPLPTEGKGENKWEDEKEVDEEKEEKEVEEEGRDDDHKVYFIPPFDG